MPGRARPAPQKLLPTARRPFRSRTHPSRRPVILDRTASNGRLPLNARAWLPIDHFCLLQLLPFCTYVATRRKFMTISIHAISLTKRYGSTRAPVWALRGVSMEAQAGERIALLGKSGSGKSTLLNLLGGLDRPTDGSVVVHGSELTSLSGAALAAYRLRTVGMIFQAFNLVAWRTAIDNVALPLVFAGVPRRERQKLATAALAAVGLAERLHHRPAELSGGEQQRVAVARAIVNHPAILLADEPTGNLDSTTAAEVLTFLLQYVQQQRSTLVLVTHDEDLALSCTERIVRLRDGATDVG